MSFVILDGNGNPEPIEVPHPLEQLKQIFDALASEAYTAAFCVISYDDATDGDEDEDLHYCTNCSREMYACYLDADGVCEDCLDQERRILLSNPPGTRTRENWVRLAELGYTDDNYPLDLVDHADFG